MFSWLRRLLKSAGGRDKIHPQDLLKTGNVDALRALASDPETDPNILYALARSEHAAVRQAVAVNQSTPVQASALLANDSNVDVRFALAARLVELLPALSEEKYSQLYAYTVQALGVLAQDEVLKIRQALSSALKDHAKAPPAVAARLARDVERVISEPILRFCVALSDEDLLDILGQHPEPWTISAIAGRPVLSDSVSDAVFETGDVPATAVLVGNKGARLSAATLQKIIDKARHYPEWHRSVAMRPELTVDLAQQLAGFVGEAVLSVLELRSDLDGATRRQIAEIVRRRLSYQAGRETAEEKLRRFLSEGGLTPEVIHDAAVWQDWDFFYLAMSHRSGLHPIVVRKMMTSGAPKPLVTACYCARLPMRVCIDLQRVVGKLQPRQILYGRGGTDYPLSREEIAWQLEFFGVKPEEIFNRG